MGKAQFPKENLHALRAAGLERDAQRIWNGDARFQIMFSGDSGIHEKHFPETLNGVVLGMSFHQVDDPEGQPTTKLLLNLGIQRSQHHNFEPVIACGYQPVFPLNGQTADGEPWTDYDEIHAGWAMLVKHSTMLRPHKNCCPITIWLFVDDHLVYHCSAFGEPEKIEPR